MNRAAIVLGRELRVHLRSKAFVISTLFAVGILTLMLVLGNISQRNQESVIAITPETAPVFAVAESVSSQSGGPRLLLHEVANEQAARQAVADRQADGGLVSSDAGYLLLDSGSLSPTASAMLMQAVTQWQVQQNSAELGIAADAIFAGAGVQVEQVGRATGDAQWRQLASIVFAMLFYMGAAIFGLSIAQGIVEERQSRIIELLASSTRLEALLVGKIISGVCLALIQLALYLSVVGVVSGFQGWADQLRPIVPVAGWFLAFYVTGLIGLGSLWAAVGAATARQEELQVKAAPMQMLLAAVLFAGVLLNGSALRIASFVPIFSCVAMPRRAIEGGVSVPELVVALALNLAFVALAVMAGGRSFNRSLKSAIQ